MKIRLSELRRLVAEAVEENIGTVLKLGRQFASSRDFSILPVLFDALEEESGNVFACGETVSWVIEASGIPAKTETVTQLNEASFEINGPLTLDDETRVEEYWEQLAQGLEMLSALGPTKVKKWGNSITFQTPLFSGEIFEQGAGFFVSVMAARDVESA